MSAFGELYQIMGDATVVQSPFHMGKVKKPLPNLEISTGDIVLKKEDLKIDKWLVDRNEALFTEDKGHSHADATGDGSHKHDIDKPIHDKLEAGDVVLLVRVNNQFIVLCKVVSL